MADELPSGFTAVEDQTPAGFTANEDAVPAGFQATEPGPASNPYVSAAMRLVPAIGGGLLGPVGGAFGGGVGELLAQMYEGQGINPKQIALSAALGLIPGAKFAGVTSPLARVGLRAGEGAVFGTGAGVASNLIEGRPVTENLGAQAGLGLALGAGGGLLERTLTRRAAAPGQSGEGFGKIPPETRPLPAFEPTQQNLFSPEALAAIPPDRRIARAAALETEIAARKEAAQLVIDWHKLPGGTEPDMFQVPTTKPPTPSSTMPALTERQIAQTNWYMRYDPPGAVRYLKNLRGMIDENHLSLGDALVGGAGQEPIHPKLGATVLPDSPTFHHEVNLGAVALRALGQQTTKILGKWGAYGRSLSEDMSRALMLTHEDKTRLIETPGTGLRDITKGFTDAENINLGKAMNGQASPMNARVAAAMDPITKLTSEFEVRAPAAGLRLKNPLTGELMPWQPHMGRYYPNMPDFNAIARDPTRLSKSVLEIQAQANEKLLAAGKPTISEGEARLIFNQMRKRGNLGYGNLEVARVFNLSDIDYHATKVYAQYLGAASQRVNQALVYGPKNEIALGKINGIDAEYGGHASKLATEMVNRITGNYELSTFQTAARAANAVAAPLETIMRLPFAWLNNATQPALVGLVDGFGPLLKGWRYKNTAEGQELGRLAGAGIEAVMRELVGSDSGNRLGSAFSKGASFMLDKMTPFTNRELNNRMWAAADGKVRGDWLLQRLQSPSAYNKWRADFYKNAFRAAGIEPMEVLRRGSLTRAEEIQLGRFKIDQTQFHTNIEDLPPFMTSEYGKWHLQFQNFAFKAAQLMWNDVMKPAVKFWQTKGHDGDMAPLLRAITVMPILGEGFNNLSAMIRGRERPSWDEWYGAKRYMENMSFAGGLSVAYDFTRAATSGFGGLARYAIGLKNSDVLDSFYNAVALANGKPRGAERQILTATPFVGQVVPNRVWPPKKRQP